MYALSLVKFFLGRDMVCLFCRTCGIQHMLSSMLSSMLPSYSFDLFSNPYESLVHILKVRVLGADQSLVIFSAVLTMSAQKGSRKFLRRIAIRKGVILT